MTVQRATTRRIGAKLASRALAHALLDEGAAFLQTYSQGNESLASHSSLWSSTYVANHRVIPSGNKEIPAKYTTLPEAMKAAGIHVSPSPAELGSTLKPALGQ